MSSIYPLNRMAMMPLAAPAGPDQNAEALTVPEPRGMTPEPPGVENPRLRVDRCMTLFICRNPISPPETAELGHMAPTMAT